MRMLLIAPVFPPEIGGVPSLYGQLCQHLPKDTVVVLAPHHPQAAEFDRQQPFPIVRRRGFAEIDLPGLLRILLEAVQVAWLVKTERITHLLIGNINQSLLALFLMPWIGRPVVLYAHGEEINKDFGGRLYSRCKRGFLQHLCRAIAVSRFTRQRLLERGGPQLRVEVIANAVDSAQFQPRTADPQLLERWQLQGKRILLTLSRLEPRKGHDQVIRALPQLLLKQPDVHYVIGGEGETLESLKQLAITTGVADQVTFLGRIAHEELCSVYNLAEVFVMPNREIDGDTEGFGIVFLEASACGLPVVGGVDGGAPDAIVDGETGYLVDGNDVDAIADRILTLLTDPARARRMGEAGRHFACAHSYPELADAVLEFVESA